MIWHREELDPPQKPVGATVCLVGIYHHPVGNNLEPPVTIKLDVQADENSTATEVILFTHQPSNTSYEPTKDEVLEKYRAKLIKARNRALRVPFVELLTLKPIL